MPRNADTLDDESLHTTTLAPPPDYRRVGLERVRSRSTGAWLALLGSGAAVGASLRGAGGALLGLGLAASSGVIARAFRRAAVGDDRSRLDMAIVPWGVLLDFHDRATVLRWAAVSSVHVHAVHGRDQGTPLTLYTVVSIETSRERFVGRATGALPLERLAVHVAAYAAEAGHRVALDLDGSRSGEGPTEPDAELVIAAARAYLATPVAAQRLELVAGYRSGVGGPGARGQSEICRVLGDRVARRVDPRPFAAVLAAELDVRAATDALLALVHSPLPLLAAFARVAAAKLGAARSQVGALEEVEPFLLARDVEVLVAWQGP